MCTGVHMQAFLGTWGTQHKLRHTWETYLHMEYRTYINT